MKSTPPSGYRFSRVMLIDDNDIDNLINSRIMTSHNFAALVDIKTTTESALEHLKTLTELSDNLPSIIFLDLNMPVLDGFIFLEEFAKMNDAVKKNCKVVVLSSSISPEDINRASTNPFVIKYINKPLSEMYLEAISF
jgi:CheY-like chemotaxis protein